jgi:hypothetical protein
MLAESDVGTRREANRKRMREVNLRLLTYVRGPVWSRNLERRCALYLWQGRVVG